MHINKNYVSQVLLYTPVIPETQKIEAGESQV